MDKITARLRPNASDGLWLAVLVPLCYCVNLLNGTSLHYEFKLTAIVAGALFGQTVLMYDHLLRPLLVQRSATEPLTSDIALPNHQKYLWIARLCLATLTTAVIYLNLHQTLLYSAGIAFAWPHLYEAFYWRTIRSLPGSFTLGEAAIVCQGFALYALNAFLLLGDFARHPAKTHLHQCAAVVQLTLLGTGIIVGVLHATGSRRVNVILFYPLCACVGAIVMAFPVAPPHGTSAIVVLVEFCFANRERVLAIAAAVLLLAVTGFGVNRFVAAGAASSTRTRKYFHALIVAVFVPGLLTQCTLLLLFSGMLLAAFVLLEAARLVRIWPVHAVLQRAVATFLDAQDASGLVALTPIYLLVGCAMPLWLHPCGCDLTDWANPRALMPLSAGVLSVGVGDAAASVVGSLVGRHKWSAGGKKSVEGTIGGILAQALFVPLYIYLGVYRATAWKLTVFAVAIVTNSVVEAKTDQIDNLVLPLVTYVILSLD